MSATRAKPSLVLSAYLSIVLEPGRVEWYAVQVVCQYLALHPFKSLGGVLVLFDLGATELWLGLRLPASQQRSAIQVGLIVPRVELYVYAFVREKVA